MKKIITTLLVGTLAVGSTFAALEEIAVVANADASVENISMPYYGNSSVKYSYDAEALKAIYDKKSSLIEVVCQSDEVFKNLGINAWSIKINNIGFSKNDLDITVDAKNCSFYANRTNRSQNNNGTTDEKALAAAQKFVDDVFGEKWIVSLPTLGKPVITWRDNGGAYPMMKDSVMDTAESWLSGVILMSGSDEKIEVQYNNITIIYPYLVGATAVYSNYGGGKMGVSVTVDGNGISSVNVPLLAFKGIAKTAEEVTFDGLKNFIAQGGNNPYYGNNGNATTVKLQAPEHVLVYFDYYNNNSYPRKFLSDGIRLGSKIKQDQRSQTNYEMIISDFIIGNNNNPILMMEGHASDATVQAEPVPVKKLTGKRTIKLKKKTTPITK